MKSAIAITLFFMFACVSNKLTIPSYWENKFSENSSDSQYISLTNPDILLKVLNNTKALQITIKVYNPTTQFGLLMNGITILIDPTGKEKKKFKLSFPPAQLSMESMRQFEQKQKILDWSNLILNVNFEGATIEFNNEETTASSNEAYLILDKNKNLNYIITLPYSKFSETSLAGKIISLGIVTERKEMSHKPNGNGMPEMDGGGPMGGMPPGGMQGHGGGIPGAGSKLPSGKGPFPESNNMSNPISLKVWTTITLSSK